MIPVILVGKARVFHGDCREVLRGLPDNSIDSVVTDPPYELGFMGKSWDSSGIAYDVSVWVECLRVLKPGGHVLAFGGSRTFHRMAVAIEDAGFEIRDSIAWMYGSGFPKSLDVSKAIDKTAGHWRGKSAGVVSGNNSMVGGNYERTPKGEPITPEAQEWKGWGTALKPAFEPIFVGRKPFAKGATVAQNVLEWGVGGLNIDASRIEAKDQAVLDAAVKRMSGNSVEGALNMAGKSTIQPVSAQGRWPANVILDEYSAGLLDEQSGVSTSKVGGPRGTKKKGLFANSEFNKVGTEHNDTGGASRFFYCAKASKRDRNEGLELMEDRNLSDRGDDGMRDENSIVTRHTKTKNFHPTVKPTQLMRYLVKLVTPPGGTVLDPFTGSGSTGKAALLDGYVFIGAELTEEYLPIIEGRLKQAQEQRAIV